MPKALMIKKNDATYNKFKKEYGTHAHELDALGYENLQLITREAIEEVIDREAYDAQVEIEEREAAFLEAASGQLGDFIAEIMDEFGDE